MRNKATMLPASLLAEAGQLISCRLGLSFPETRRNELERGLRAAMRELGFEDVSTGLGSLISSPPGRSQLDVLATHLTVGETYFFRDSTCFAFLTERVFPELLTLRRRAGRYLRMWSAGCCSGEEAYSLAILLETFRADLAEWDVHILGTDINRLFLKKAAAGVYGDWSFRGAPGWIRERFFRKTGASSFELLPQIRRRVRFMHHNLVEKTLPLAPEGPMDLIVCRNVLMYLTQDHQKAVIGRFHLALAEGGWLIVSPTEVSTSLFRDFESVNFQGATFYRKRRQKSKSTLAPGMKVPVHQPQVKRESMPVVPGAVRAEKSGLPDGKCEPYEEALLLYHEGRAAEAAGKLAPLLDDKRQEGRAAALLSRICADQGKLPEAMSLCERAISAERVEPAHYYLRAVIFEEQGKSQEAGEDLRRALYLDEDFVPAHLLLGNLALRGGKKAESARHFKNALKALGRRLPDEIVPWGEGITAARLMEMVKSAGFEDAS